MASEDRVAALEAALAERDRQLDNLLTDFNSFAFVQHQRWAVRT